MNFPIVRPRVKSIISFAKTRTWGDITDKFTPALTFFLVSFFIEFQDLKKDITALKL